MWLYQTNRSLISPLRILCNLAIIPRYRRTLLVCLAMLGSYAHLSYASCEQFEAEAEAFDGVIPKFDSESRIRAFVMYGEGAFIANKRSLIAEARREAEGNARLAFSQFITTDFDAERLSQKMVAQVETTGSSGETEGIAAEMKASLQTMKSSTSSVLSGLVKLDECVDTDEKYVLVSLGWKPSLASVAAEASAANQSAASGQSSSRNNSSPSLTSSAPSEPSKVESDTKLAGVSFVNVQVEGFGDGPNQATQEALMAAVSQVHGEAFAGRSETKREVQQLTVTDSNGNSVGAAAELTTGKSSTSRSTSGLISNWQIIERGESQYGYRMVLEVRLPVYKSTIGAVTNTIIVATPIVNSSVESETSELFVESLLISLEQRLNNLENLTVLDRDNSQLLESELRVTEQTADIAELARLGRQVSADFILVVTIDAYDHQIDSTVVGSTTFEKSVFNVSLTSKLIEVATGNLVSGKTTPLRNRKVTKDNPVFEAAQVMSKTTLETVTAGLWTQPKREEANAAQSANLDEARKDADSVYEEALKNVDDDW